MFRHMIFAVFLLACIAAKAQRTGFSIRVTVEDSLNGQYWKMQPYLCCVYRRELLSISAGSKKEIWYSLTSRLGRIV